MKVSIIVAVYNGEKTLARTIESLLSQTHSNIELLLVDDGSSDSSYNIINTYLHDPRVFYFKKDNGGVASARNFGLKNSTGEFVAFCDQDDQWFSDKLQKQLPFFHDASIGLVYSWVEVNTLGKITYSKPTYSGKCFKDLLKRNFITCCTAIVRKTLIMTVNGFDEDKTLQGVDDKHLWLRIARISKFAVFEQPLATYFIHGENYSLNERKMLVADLVCVRKIASMNSLSTKEKHLCELSEYDIYLHYANNLLYQNDPTASGKCYLNAYKMKPMKIRLLLKGLFLSLLSPRLLIQLKDFYHSVRD